MRSIAAMAVMVLIGAALTASPESSAFAAGFARKHDASRYAGRRAALPHHPARYFRCRGGRFYTVLGGWGCDYYYSPLLPAPPALETPAEPVPSGATVPKQPSA